MTIFPVLNHAVCSCKSHCDCNRICDCATLTRKKHASIPQVLKNFLRKRNITVEGSAHHVTWLSYQECDDMYMFSKWNQTTTYGFGANKRDFGTDYGICCWYTPQLNFSEIPEGPDTDWAFWFNSVPKGNNKYSMPIVLPL